MSTLDFSPDFDGIRDVLDSKTSTSGGSGSVAMNESHLRERVSRKNGSGMVGNGVAPNYNTGTASEARQAADFRNTFRVTTGQPTPSYSVPSTKSSATTYWYGWGTQIGVNVANLNYINVQTGKCWTGTTNHTNTAVPLNPYSGPSVSTTLDAVGAKISSGGSSGVLVFNADPRPSTGSGIFNTGHTRSHYTNGTDFPAGSETQGSTSNALNTNYTFNGNTRFYMQWGGGIYTGFLHGGIPQSGNSAFTFSFLPA